MQRSELVEAIRVHTRDHGEKIGCSKAIKAGVIPAELLEKAKSILPEVRFNRRRYGTSDFYCWAVHELFNERVNGISPWPAMKYPNDVLLCDIAIRLLPPDA